MSQKFIRKLNRLPTSEIYKTNNSFFVTICTSEKRCIFAVAEGLSLQSKNTQHDIAEGLSLQSDDSKIGDIKSPLRLNYIGKIVKEIWVDLPNIFENIMIEDFIVMPNHFHGIITFLDKPHRKSHQSVVGLSEIIGYFKAYSQKIIREKFSDSLYEKWRYKIASTGFNHNKIWQKSFYDHIIRDENDLQRIREYIINNPLQWELDLLNPKNQAKK